MDERDVLRIGDRLCFCYSLLSLGIFILDGFVAVYVEYTRALKSKHLDERIDLTI